MDEIRPYLISDSDAMGRSKDIGSEFDVEVSWQVLSDVNLTFQYGHFEPGGAYPPSGDDPEDYLSFSTVVLF